MAEPTQEQREADFFQTAYLQGMEPDGTEFDRQTIGADEFSSLLDMFGTYSPLMRANTYGFLYQTLSERGTEALHDYEIALLAWAPQDELATRAVEEGGDGSLYNGSWYEEYVSHYGSLDDARDAILKADGWEEPGLGGRMLRTAGDLLQGNIVARETNTRAEGMTSLIGREVFAPDSRLADILDTALLVSREDVGNMHTTGDRVYLTGYTTAEIIGSMFITGKVIGSGWRAVKAGKPIERLASTKMMQTILKSKTFNQVTRFSQAFGNVYGKSSLWQQNLGYLSHRTGLPADKLLRLPGKMIASDTMYGKRAAQIAASWMIFNVSSDVAIGAMFGEAVDAVAVKRRAEQLEREGLTPEEAEVQATKEIKDEEEAERVQDRIDLNPLQAAIEFGVDASGEPVGSKVQTDSPAYLALDMSLFEVDQATVEATARVEKANFYERTTAELERQGKYTGTMDPDAVDSILQGESEPTDFDEFRTASELRVQAGIDDLAGQGYDVRYVDVEEEDIYALEEQGYTVIEDISAPSDAPRNILLDPRLTAPQFGEYIESLEDAPEDPLIRVPEGYSAITFRPSIEGVTGAWQEDLSGSEASLMAALKRKPLAFERDAEIPAEYRQSMVLDQINQMSYAQVIKFQDLAGQAGFYGTSGEPFTNGYMTEQDQEAVSIVMGQANVDGERFWEMLGNMAQDPGKYRKVTEQATTTTSTRLPYSVPLSLRSIPGPKTIAEDAKARFAQKLGRDPLQQELDSIASELTGYHRQQTDELIALDMARWEGNNQGLLTGESIQQIEDPGAATSFDISAKWKDEINLNERREANSDTFNRMLNATLGGRSSMGGLTPGTDVGTIGRAG